MLFKVVNLITHRYLRNPDRQYFLIYVHIVVSQHYDSPEKQNSDTEGFIMHQLSIIIYSNSTSIVQAQRMTY